MTKNTSISLGDHFDEFIKNSISAGRFKNVSEVIRAGLRLLEAEEHKIMMMKNAVKEPAVNGTSHPIQKSEK